MPNRLPRIARTGAILLVGALAPSVAPAQQPATTVPAEVMILGTYHFANPGLDVVKTQVVDVLTPAKQREIAEVVDALARFQPTKIAVEDRPEAAARLDSLYRAYRAGGHTLRRDETEQLGFRLAERAGHSRLHPIDHRGEFPFPALMAYAQQRDPDFVQEVQRTLGYITERENRWQRELSVAGNLRVRNDPAHLRQGHGFYVGVARVGAGDTYVGADLLAKWYERNIGIFANIQRIVEPGDRVLVIIGSGHAPILRELVAHDPRMRLVEANDYLPGPAVGVHEVEAPRRPE